MDLLASAAEAAQVRLKVVVDLNCGSNRTGIATGKTAVALARQVARQPWLEFDGFQAFASHVMHMPGYDERRRADLEALERVVGTRRLAEQAGLDVAIAIRRRNRDLGHRLRRGGCHRRPGRLLRVHGRDVSRYRGQ